MKTKPSILDTLLEEPFPWPQTLDESGYSRQHDDTDGEPTGYLTVMFGPDGDAYVGVDGTQLLRFRTHAGGGRSLRVHAALVVLAEAIRRDNEQDTEKRG